jgi:hypothetical protein
MTPQEKWTMGHRGLVGVFSLALAGLAGVPHGEAAVAFQVPLRPSEEGPAISSPASGEITITVNDSETGLEFQLVYEGLAGNVTQAHLHLAQRGVNGAIVIYLCSNLPDPPPDTPACPASPGQVSGTLTAEDVIDSPGAKAQGVEPGELAEVIAAAKAGVVYANVHSDKFPGGEIRGQLRRLGR